MSFSDYLEDAVLDHICGDGAMTSPSSVYLALSTADPTDDASGLAEPAGGSYARVEVPASSFAAASGGSKSLSADVVFPEATASWGTITHLALMDSSSGGEMLVHSALDTAKAIGDEDTLTVPSGSFTITLS